MNPQSRPNPNSNRRDPAPRSGLVVGVAGAIAAVAVAAVALIAFSSNGDGGDEASLGGEQVTAQDPASPEGEVDADDGAATTPTSTDAGDATGSTPTSSNGASSSTPGSASTASSGSAPSSTTGGQPTSTIAVTDDTVEADETTDDPDDEDPNPGDPDDQGRGGPAPTSPPPTSGACRLAATDFDGRSGVVELGTSGACDAVSATIEAVNPRDDLTGSDWGRDIRVCQRHPAAGAVRIEITTGAGTVELTEGWSRSAQEAEADPVQTITISFDDQDTPSTGPRPVAVCRTDEAELSIVHRPPR